MASSPPFQDPLDKLRSAADELDKVLVHVPGSQLSEISGVLRGVNRQLWRMIDQLEAGRVAYLYDTYGLIRRVAEASGVDHIDAWIELAEAGVVKLNHKELLKLGEKRGIDVTEYMEEPDDDGDDV